MGFPCGSAGKESACNAGDLGLIPGLGRSPGEGKGYPLLYSGLENSMDHIVHGVAKSWTRLSNFHFPDTTFHWSSSLLSAYLLSACFQRLPFQTLKLGRPSIRFTLLSQHLLLTLWAFQVDLVVKNPPANAGDTRDLSWIPGSGRSPGRGHENPLQYSCLKS